MCATTSPHHYQVPVSIAANHTTTPSTRPHHLCLCCVAHDDVLVCKAGCGNGLLMAVLAVDDAGVGAAAVLVNAVPHLGTARMAQTTARHSTAHNPIRQKDEMLLLLSTDTSPQRLQHPGTYTLCLDTQHCSWPGQG